MYTLHVYYSWHGVRMALEARTVMALIEDTIGELPYQLTDFDQHSYEAEDCSTRYMPSSKLDTAVRPIIAPSGRKVLLAAPSPTQTAP